MNCYYCHHEGGWMTEVSCKHDRLSGPHITDVHISCWALRFWLPSAIFVFSVLFALFNLLILDVARPWVVLVSVVVAFVSAAIAVTNSLLP
jgi:hypothetical protein